MCRKQLTGPEEAPEVWDGQRKNLQRRWRRTDRRSRRKTSGWGLIPKPKSILRTKGVVSSVGFESDQETRAAVPVGSWCPWAEQTQGKLKGRGHSSLNGLERKASEGVGKYRGTLLSGLEGEERTWVRVFNIPCKGEGCYFLFRVQRDEIMCPFSHHHSKQKPPHQ